MDVRKLAIALLAVFFLLCGAIAAGLRFNVSHSFPVGLYLTSAQLSAKLSFVGKSPEKGDLVMVDPPPLPIFAMAVDRGYISKGYTPAGCVPLIKRLAGIAGDRVTIDLAGVEVNGVRLTNSAPLTKDAAGRPLHFYPLQNYILGPNEVLLMSEYSAASWDARYFGPLQATTIESVITPILTWN
jgi:conjugative transfer signal peptidase TraF